MAEPATQPNLIGLIDDLDINLEEAQHCLNAIKHLDDSAVTFEEWREVRRGLMCLVDQVRMQVDQSMVEIRSVHADILRPPATQRKTLSTDNSSVS